MFNKQNVREFRSDFQQAVAQLEKDYGVNISLGNISFNGEELRSKMTAQKGAKVASASKDDFNIGDVVGINHKKIDKADEFKITKINSKSITVEKIKVANGRVGAIMRVSPSLLVKK
tara:strand:- start:21 stop:371 length:351 start_codon:yes stop_codon:yes gene_type:complete